LYDDGSKLIFFIDDLDRCSPKKALEVFESVKVFLGLKGFMYIIGLSHETISKLITAEYQNSSIKKEQHIRKIIQIRITIPEWNDVDINELIHNLSTKLDDKYKEIIEQPTTSPIAQSLVVVKNRFVYISSIMYFLLSVLCLIKRILCLQFLHFVTTYVISFNLLA
jgi:predicted KAP-like P-loop ATPase